MKQFSEATRVQMPAMVHLTRIGYTYFGKLSEDKNGTVYDGDTNILLPIFEQQFKKLNPGHEGEYLQVLKDIRKEFFEPLLFYISFLPLFSFQKTMRLTPTACGGG